jgi:predicted PurR-regulated permease PerM
VLLYLSFLVIRPFLSAVVISLVLAYLFYPVYRWLQGLVKSTTAASAIMVLLILALIVVPTAFIISSLVEQSIAQYALLSSMNLPGIFNGFLSQFGLTFDAVVNGLALNVKDYVVSSVPNIINGFARIVLGLFVMFFLLFFAFRDGGEWITAAKRAVPLEAEYKRLLFDQVKNVTRGVLYGQFLTAVIQGTLGGLMFAAFGLPNPVFWGAIMIVLSFIPFLGTPIVWLPAGIIELMSGHYVVGVGVLVVGTLIVMNIDNVLKPRLIGGRARLSTPTVLLGVLGGLALFGFIGLVLGPLILALLQTTLRFFEERETLGAGKSKERSLKRSST